MTAFGPKKQGLDWTERRDISIKFNRSDYPYPNSALLDLSK